MQNGFEPNCLIQIYHKPEKKNKNLRFAICASPIIYLLFLNFSWALQLSQEKEKTMLVQLFFLGGEGRVFLGQIRCIVGDVQMTNKEDSVSNLSKCKCKGCIFNSFLILFG